MVELITPQSQKHEIDFLQTDLDATLGNRIISEKSADAIFCFLVDDPNRDVAIVSARPPASTKRAVKHAGLERFLGTQIHITGFNGSIVYYGERILHDQSIPSEAAETILEKSRQQDLTGTFFTPDETYFLQDNHWTRTYSGLTGYPMITKFPHRRQNYYMIELIKDPEEDLEAFKQRVGMDVFEKKGEIRSACYPKSIYDELQDPPINFIQINTANVDKADAAQAYMKLLKISPERVLIIGDELNDKKSLELEGVVSVAMGNAPEEVKQVARYVTRTVEQEGVAYTLEHLVR